MTGQEPGSKHGSRGAVPFHCPFCAETDLWPHEPAGWECRGCLRAFSIQLHGIVTPKKKGGGA